MLWVLDSGAKLCLKMTPSLASAELKPRRSKPRRSSNHGTRPHDTSIAVMHVILDMNGYQTHVKFIYIIANLQHNLDAALGLSFLTNQNPHISSTSLACPDGHTVKCYISSPAPVMSTTSMLIKVWPEKYLKKIPTPHTFLRRSPRIRRNKRHWCPIHW